MKTEESIDFVVMDVMGTFLVWESFDLKTWIDKHRAECCYLQTWHWAN